MVTSQGIRFNNLLYRSDALKTIVGQRVRLKFDGPAGDRAVVIWGESIHLERSTGGEVENLMNFAKLVLGLG
ncbi:Mu transposase C-terminal domain-containing protein [Pseudomonas syringae]|uniref:Mu transposase C-terminal domain-containing protein n=1 Tax=Pseudomonas sp. PvP027 TaxID=2806587 RepID=UPI0023BAB7F5